MVSNTVRIKASLMMLKPAHCRQSSRLWPDTIAGIKDDFKREKLARLDGRCIALNVIKKSEPILAS
jgi:hypothetical protein